MVPINDSRRNHYELTLADRRWLYPWNKGKVSIRPTGGLTQPIGWSETIPQADRNLGNPDSFEAGEPSARSGFI